MKTIIAVILALLVGAVQAQEVLKGKIPAAEGTCYFDKNFQLKKGNPHSAFCVMAVDPKRNDAMWVVLFQNGNPVAVIEVAVPDGTQTVVWRKGQIDS